MLPYLVSPLVLKLNFLIFWSDFQMSRFWWFTVDKYTIALAAQLHSDYGYVNASVNQDIPLFTLPRSLILTCIMDAGMVNWNISDADESLKSERRVDTLHTLHWSALFTVYNKYSISTV